MQAPFNIQDKSNDGMLHFFQNLYFAMAPNACCDHGGMHEFVKRLAGFLTRELALKRNLGALERKSEKREFHQDSEKPVIQTPLMQAKPARVHQA